MFRASCSVLRVPCPGVPGLRAGHSHTVVGRDPAAVHSLLIGAPKKQRKGHEFTFRVDLAWPDTQGAPKYIISCASAVERDAWVEAFTNHRAAGMPHARPSPCRARHL